MNFREKIRVTGGIGMIVVSAQNFIVPGRTIKGLKATIYIQGSSYTRYVYVTANIQNSTTIPLKPVSAGDYYVTISVDGDDKIQGIYDKWSYMIKVTNPVSGFKNI